MIKAIIIDDEPLARLIVQEYLQAYPEITVVQECCDGFEGIKAIQQYHPDLIFLDIQMPKINGFEMLELVEDPPAVIFTTAFDEYAIRAFEAHAVDYLLKPFNKQRFEKAIRKWLDQHALAQAAATASAPPVAGTSASPAPAGHAPGQHAGSPQQTNAGSETANSSPDSSSGSPDKDPTHPAAPAVNHSRENTRALLETASHSPSQQHRVVVKTGGKIKIIPVEDIHYLEASDDYVKIHTHNGAFLKNKTMSYFEQVLDNTQFVRTHRSYILNVQQVTRIDPYEKDSHLCILQSGAQVPVSKAGYVKLKAVLGL
jgi:two-component system, LytTR family, response regulator